MAKRQMFRVVQQIDPVTGAVIREVDKIVDLAKYGIPKNNISSAIRTGKVAYGYKWAWSNWALDDVEEYQAQMESPEPNVWNIYHIPQLGKWGKTKLDLTKASTQEALIWFLSVTENKRGIEYVPVKQGLTSTEAKAFLKSKTK